MPRPHNSQYDLGASQDEALATPTITLTDNGGTYNGSTYPATTASIESVTPTLTYYSGTNTSGTALSGAPSAAGTYTVLASFAGSTDYSSGTASTTFTISPSGPVGSYYRVTSLADGAGTLTTAGSDGTEAHPFLDTTLRGAIIAANGAGGIDTIEFDSSLTSSGPALITLTLGELLITNAMNIVGPGASSLTVSGNNASRIFDVDANDNGAAQVGISGLTLSGGNGTGTNASNSGGAIYNAETLTLNNSALTGNSITAASAQGGGIANVKVLFATGDTISDNSLSTSGMNNNVFGAGIYNTGTVTANDDTITGNTASVTVGPGGGALGPASTPRERSRPTTTRSAITRRAVPPVTRRARAGAYTTPERSQPSTTPLPVTRLRRARPARSL